METVAVYFEKHKKRINTLCGDKMQFYYVKAGGTYNNHWNLKD
jgi:hypothetical protein